MTNGVWNDSSSPMEAHIAGKGGGGGYFGFLEHFDAIWGLVMQREEVERLRAEKDSWGNVEDVLLKVVDASRIGRRLFGFAVQNVMGNAIAKKCDEAITKLFAGKVTESKVCEVKRGLMSTLNDLPGVDNLVERREVQMEYRGIQIKVKVASLLEEAALRVDCAIRSRAVQLGGLCKLASEDALVRDPAEVSKVDIAESVLRTSSAARSMFNRALATSDSVDSAGIQVAGPACGLWHPSLLRFLDFHAVFFSLWEGP